MDINSDWRRFILIAFAGISLLTGIWVGVARMGWVLPLPNERWVVLHGPLMVVGFLGVLIGLERAVALERRWAYAIPICAGLSTLLALVGAPLPISASLAVLAAIFLVAVFITLYRHSPTEHFVIMALSALTWAVGNVLWFAEAAIFALVPWWVGLSRSHDCRRTVRALSTQATAGVGSPRLPRMCCGDSRRSCVFVIRPSYSRPHLRARLFRPCTVAASLRPRLEEYEASGSAAFHGALSHRGIFVACGGRNPLDGVRPIFLGRTALRRNVALDLFGFCFFDDLCPRANHIADHYRTRIAVSERFLSPRRLIASFAGWANCR